MHFLYENDDNNKRMNQQLPGWMDGQIYVIDWFLWYMAGRGYKLQKSRAKLNWRKFENYRILFNNELNKLFV